MLIPSILFLNYPCGNSLLFNLFTTYVFFIGAGSDASGWIPGIPFIVQGFYGLSLIVIYRMKDQWY